MKYYNPLNLELNNLVGIIHSVREYFMPVLPQLLSMTIILEKLRNLSFKPTKNRIGLAKLIFCERKIFDKPLSVARFFVLSRFLIPETEISAQVNAIRVYKKHYA